MTFPRDLLLGALLAGSALVASPALAQETQETQADPSEEEDFEEGSVTGSQHQRATTGEATRDATRQDDAESYTPRFTPQGGEQLTIQEYAARPFPAVVYRGADALGLAPEFVNDCYEGIQMVYQRDYKGAKSHWDAVNQKYPGRGVGHFGNLLVYQSLMLENFDYRYDSQYQFHSDRAIAELEASLETPGADAWEYFLLGGAVGIESIHMMRKGDFVPALSRGFDAMAHVAKTKELAPMFPDPVLGDGMYKYWRSVVTLNSKVLPDFEDLREEGIEEMTVAEHEAIFVRPAATMALAFTWIEERRFRKALSSCMMNRRAYPNNVINNLLTGRVYMYMRDYDRALKIFEDVQADEPDNMRVYYYKGVVQIRQRDYDAAEASLDAYMQFDLEDEFRAAAWYRKGQVAYFRQDYKTAEKHFKEAVNINGHKASKAKISHIKKLKRQGKI